MNAHSVDSETLYRAQETTWKWLKSLFSSSEEKVEPAASDATQVQREQTAQQRADGQACCDSWLALSCMNTRESHFMNSGRWYFWKH